MQTVETLRRLGDLDREMIEHRVRSLLEFKAVGAVEALAEFFSVDVVCQNRGKWSSTAFPRPIVGNAAVIREFKRLNMNYQNVDSEIHELIIDGDRVVLHRTATGRNRGSGRPYQFDTIMFLRFRDGLIT